jgi:hypothetical protein
MPRMVPQTAVKPVKAPEGGISARVGPVVSFAECEVLTTRVNATNGDVEIITTAEVIDVYNQQTADVMTQGERFGQAALHEDGRWWAISDDCKDNGTG